MSDAGNKTQRLCDGWDRAVKDVEQAKRDLRRSETMAENSMLELANHLAPSDMKPGEVIGIWVRFSSAGGTDEKLVSVTKHATRGLQLLIRGQRA